MPPLRKIQFTTLEHDRLCQLMHAQTGLDLAATRKVDQSILRKLRAAAVAAPSNLAVAPLEAALIAGGGPKIAKLVTGHARASVRATQVKATVEDMRAVGEWIATQRWLGGATILTVLNKWDEWLPLARQRAAPSTKPAPGFGPKGNDDAPDLGQGSAGPGQKNPTGRRTPGFR